MEEGGIVVGTGDRWSHRVYSSEAGRDEHGTQLSPFYCVQNPSIGDGAAHS